MKYQFVGQCTLCCLVGWLVVLGLMAISVSISVYTMSVFFHLQKSQTQYFSFFFFFFFGKFLQDRENSVGKYYRASILSRLPVQIMLLGCRLYGYISHALFKMVEKALGLYICDYQFSSMAYNTLRRRFM